MRTESSIGRRLRAAIITTTVALLAALLATPTAGATVEPCTSPPPVFPIDQLTAGMTATGWTVLQGTTPESFPIEILGVLTDAIGPGYDLILVKASGANIDNIGGMGPGFSGSPVYRDGQLVGSISYGLGGDAHYGALTPGQLLVNVLEEPQRSIPDHRTVRLTRAERRLIARDSQVSVSDVSSTLTQIPLPLAVAGASDERMTKTQERLAKDGVSVLPYRASSSSSSAEISAGDPIEPGDVFTAAISYGAIAYAGIGTATISCGDYVVAFGHSFLHAGGGPDGAALDGEVVTTIPAGGFYPYPFKIANIGSLRGSIDQDRLAGVRGVIGSKPRLTTISSSITNLDNGRVSDATTQVALPGWTAYVIWDHVYASLHSALDAHQGVAWVKWIVAGRSDGQRFRLELTNAYSGRRVLYGPASDVYTTLRTIDNAKGHARISHVRIDATVTEAHDYALIHKPRTASTSEPGFAVRSSINVAAGDTLDVRVPIQQADTGLLQVAQTSFVIPDSVRGRGELEVYPGHGYFYVRNPGTLEQAFAKLQNVPRGYELWLAVRMRGMNHPLRQRLAQPWALKGEPEPVTLRLVA
jgi:hypothetical protein